MTRGARKGSAVVAQEQADCLRLKLDGLTVRETAAALGLPKSTVQERLDAAIAELVLPVAAEVRQIELMRLDRWQRRLEAAMVPCEHDDEADDDTPAQPVCRQDIPKVITTALRVQERRSKYLGLDVPERSEIAATLTAADPAVEALLQRGRVELT